MRWGLTVLPVVPGEGAEPVGGEVLEAAPGPAPAQHPDAALLRAAVAPAELQAVQVVDPGGAEVAGVQLAGALVVAEEGEGGPGQLDHRGDQVAARVGE